MANLTVGDVFRLNVCVQNSTLPRRARLVLAYGCTATAGASASLAQCANRVGIAWSNFLSFFASSNLKIEGVTYSMLAGVGDPPGHTVFGFVWGGPSATFGPRLCTRILLDCGLPPRKNGRVFVPFVPSSWVVWGDRPAPAAALTAAILAHRGELELTKVATNGVGNSASLILGVWDRSASAFTPIQSIAVDPLLRFQRRRGPWWCETPFP